LIPWLIIRTDIAKELYVAKELADIGYATYCPFQVSVSRPSVARRVSALSNVRNEKKNPLMPGKIFAAMPVAVAEMLDALPRLVGFDDVALPDGEIIRVPRYENWQKIDHVEGLLRMADGTPFTVQDEQIATFRQEIDRMNTATLARNAVMTARKKAKWENIKDALQRITEQAKTELEIAA
jgi:hypothetical protein